MIAVKPPVPRPLLISIEVPATGNVKLHYTTPDGSTMPEVFALFEKAIQTLRAEIDEAARCPMHREMAG